MSFHRNTKFLLHFLLLSFFLLRWTKHRMYRNICTIVGFCRDGRPSVSTTRRFNFCLIGCAVRIYNPKRIVFADTHMENILMDEQTSDRPSLITMQISYCLWPPPISLAHQPPLRQRRKGVVKSTYNRIRLPVLQTMAVILANSHFR